MDKFEVLDIKPKGPIVERTKYPDPCGLPYSIVYFPNDVELGPETIAVIEQRIAAYREQNVGR